MKKQDMDDLWKLLGTFRKNDPRLEDTALKEAWYLVLKPYKPSDVGNAVAAYFREAKFWPDPTDIAKRCTADAPMGSGRASSNHSWRANGYEDEADYLAQMRALREMGKLMEHDYAAAGILHPNEAKKRGWTVAEWNDRCRAALGDLV